MTEINLETGLKAGEKPSTEKPKSRLSGGRPSGSGSSGSSRGSSSTSSSPSSKTAWKDPLRTRLNTAIGKISQWRKDKGDEELAEVLDEDGRRIVDGVITIAERLPFVRGPLTILVTGVEVFLAFGRIGILLLSRLQTVRQSRSTTQSQESNAAYPPEYQAG